MTNHRAPQLWTVHRSHKRRSTRIALYVLGALVWALENQTIRAVVAYVITGVIVIGACYLLGVSGVMQGGR